MEKDRNHYTLLLIMAALHFMAMYALMYSMVARWENVIPNLNNFYMAGLMTAPMIIIEILLMRSMYPSMRNNVIVAGASFLVLALFFLFIRQQTLIGDEEFLRSMIPHHSGAVLMCEQASLEDPELIQLCQEIIANQEAEIAQMEAIRESLGS